MYKYSIYPKRGKEEEQQKKKIEVDAKWHTQEITPKRTSPQQFSTQELKYWSEWEAWRQ